MTPAPHLLVMRLADMVRVHPNQITAKCSRCGEKVGVYPSGQKVMREVPDIELVCQACNPNNYDVSLLAPGAEFEPFESKRNPKMDWFSAIFRKKS
jgi:hypothetical protein